MNTNVLLMGVLDSAVGLGLFVYGKKAIRWPHLVAGLALMLVPYVVSSVMGLALITLGLLGFVWFLREH